MISTDYYIIYIISTEYYIIYIISTDYYILIDFTKFKNSFLNRNLHLYILFK